MKTCTECGFRPRSIGNICETCFRRQMQEAGEQLRLKLDEERRDKDK